MHNNTTAVSHNKLLMVNFRAAVRTTESVTKQKDECPLLNIQAQSGRILVENTSFWIFALNGYGRRGT